MTGLNDDGGFDRAQDRAEVVRAFLTQEHRTAASARECANRLGISRSSFYRLARAFDAGMTELRTHGATGVPRLQEGVERQITLVLDRIGSEGRVADAHALVVLACRRLGLHAPVKDVVKKRMAERRKLSDAALPGSCLQYDEPGLGLAVTTGNARTLPSLAMLLHGATGRVLAHRLDPAPHEGTMLRIIDAIGLPEGMRLDRPRLKGGAAAAVFGSRLGPFPLRPRAAGRAASKHYRFEAGLEEARRIVGGLVDEHNAGRPQI